MAKELKDALRALFPGDHPITHHPWVTPMLKEGETVVWQGTRERSGEYSMVRQMVSLVLLILAAVVLANFAGISPDLLLSLMDQDSPEQFMVPIGVIAALFVFGVVRARRDPAQEWVYAVTDQRLLTFYKGEPLRIATPDDVERFAARRDIEARIRGTGDVTWALGTQNKGNHGGPDRGRHGFLAIKNPVEMRDRLKQWRGLVYDHGDDADLAFSRQVQGETAGVANDCAPDHAAADSGIPVVQPQQAVSGVAVKNRPRGFVLTIPQHWTGRMAIRKTERLKLLGVELPIPTLVFDNEAHLPQTTDDWNFLELQGLGGVSFELEVADGPVPTTYAAEMTALEKNGQSDGIVQTFPEISQDGLSGFSIIYDLRTGAVSLDTGVVRRVWLGNDEYHLNIYAKVTASDSGAQSEALDAMIASTRSV